jgi:hypothetical protein
MWSRWSREHHLRLLLSRIDCAREPTRELVEEVLERACPRLQVSPAPNDLLTRLIDSEAWVALALWLIEWELPDWGVHRLSRGDYCWNCAIRVRGLGRNWIGDVADFQHDVLALAIFGALVDAQLQKLGGCQPAHSGHVGTGQEGDGAQHDLCERPPRLRIAMRWALDTHSAYQVRLFLGEAAFLVLFGFPALLLNPHGPVLFFVC